MSQNQDESLYADPVAALEDLWNRLGDVSALARSFDRDLLDKSDLAQLEQLERITAGYATGVMGYMDQCEEGLVDDAIASQALPSFILLVQTHCEEAGLALRAALDEQQGRALRPVRVL